jgi:hypothetical protein
MSCLQKRLDGRSYSWIHQLIDKPPETFTPAELYLLFQQKGLLEIYAKGKGFVKALTTGRFPFEEVEKFVNGEAVNR